MMYFYLKFKGLHPLVYCHVFLLWCMVLSSSVNAQFDCVTAVPFCPGEQPGNRYSNVEGTSISLGHVNLCDTFFSLDGPYWFVMIPTTDSIALKLKPNQMTPYPWAIDYGIQVVVTPSCLFENSLYCNVLPNQQPVEVRLGRLQPGEPLFLVIDKAGLANYTFDVDVEYGQFRGSNLLPSPTKPNAIFIDQKLCAGDITVLSVDSTGGFTPEWTLPSGWNLRKHYSKYSIEVKLSDQPGIQTLCVKNRNCSNLPSPDLCIAVTIDPANPDPPLRIQHQLCEEDPRYFFAENGLWYYPGNYLVQVPRVNDCDEYYQLDLLPYGPRIHNKSIAVCLGEMPLQIGPYQIMYPGWHKLVFKNQNGCDSVEQLYVDVLNQELAFDYHPHLGCNQSVQLNAISPVDDLQFHYDSPNAPPLANNDLSVVVTQPGTYYLTGMATNADGKVCYDTVSTNVLVYHEVPPILVERVEPDCMESNGEIHVVYENSIWGDEAGVFWKEYGFYSPSLINLPAKDYFIRLVGPNGCEQDTVFTLLSKPWVQTFDTVEVDDVTKAMEVSERFPLPNGCDSMHTTVYFKKPTKARPGDAPVTIYNIAPTTGHGRVAIKPAHAEAYTCTVHALDGKQVARLQGMLDATLDLAPMPNGWYLLTLTNSQHPPEHHWVQIIHDSW